MNANATQRKLSSNRFVITSAVSTLVAFVLCLSTHIITLIGLAGAVAWLGTIEHALLFLTLGLALLTIYAIYRHRRCCEHAGT